MMLYQFINNHFLKVALKFKSLEFLGTMKGGNLTKHMQNTCAVLFSAVRHDKKKIHSLGASWLSQDSV